MKQSLLGAPAAEAKRLPVTLLLEWGTEFKHYFREEATVSEERVQGQKRVMRTENTPNSSFKKRLLNLKLVPHTEDSTRNRAEKQILPIVHMKIWKGIVRLPWEGSNLQRFTTTPG